MRKFTLLLLFIMFGSFCSGQNHSKIDLIAGVGLPEFFHLGFKTQVAEKHLIGLYYGNGFTLANNGSYNSFTVDHQYHFGKISKFSQRRVWFFRQGLAYTIDNSKFSRLDDLILELSLGREFNITSRFGLSGDVGLFKALSETETINDPSYHPWVNLTLASFPVLPVFRLQLFYLL